MKNPLRTSLVAAVIVLGGVSLLVHPFGAVRAHAYQKQELLADLAAAVRSRQMPPPRYTLMHRNTKLSERELDQIYQWARGERRRLKSLATDGGASAGSAANQ